MQDKGKNRRNAPRAEFGTAQAELSDYPGWAGCSLTRLGLISLCRDAQARLGRALSDLGWTESRALGWAGAPQHSAGPSFPRPGWANS